MQAYQLHKCHLLQLWKLLLWLWKSIDLGAIHTYLSKLSPSIFSLVKKLNQYYKCIRWLTQNYFLINLFHTMPNSFIYAAIAIFFFFDSINIFDSFVYYSIFICIIIVLIIQVPVPYLIFLQAMSLWKYYIISQSEWPLSTQKLFGWSCLLFHYWG